MRILFALLLSTALFASSELDRMIGQMIMVGFHGTSTKDDWVKQIASEIKNGEIGGVVLYGYNIKNPDQLKDLTERFHYQNPKIPLLVAADQEGGKIERLTRAKYFTGYPSAKAVAKTSVQNAQAVYRDLACELRGYGINLNFAPVVDLDSNKSEIIGKLNRAFSSDPKEVAKYAKAFIDSHKSCGVHTSIKHFPGHGFAHNDSHQTSVDATDTFSDEELLPFETLITQKQAESVMISHIIDKNIDELPASLSKKHIQRVRDMGFDGVLISDDLQMKAITEHFEFEEIVLLSIEAGVDILVFSNYFYQDPEIPAKVLEIVKNAVESGRISTDRIEESYKRILKFKK